MYIKDKILKHNNNYSSAENIFKKASGSNLVRNTDYDIHRENINKLPTLSIVIPYFNDRKSIVLTLQSINNQTNINFKKIEVIIIDDGSILEVPTMNKLKYELRIIKLKKNLGLVRVRNIGLLIARNEVLMYLDADMILHVNTLYNHLLAHFSTNMMNLIMVGYREWIEPSDMRLTARRLTNSMIDLSSDFRIKITFDRRHLPYISNKKLLGQTHYVVRDSNFYKNFKNGYKYLHYTLSSQVHGFLFSLPLVYALEAGPVGETEKGWGADDTLIATKFIANGSKVIPLLNSKGLHLYSINGNRVESDRQKERLRNKRRLADLLAEPYVKFFKHYDKK